MNVFFVVTYVLLAAAVALFALRLIVGPQVADRVIALDGVLVVTLGGVLVEAARRGTATSIDAVLVVALLGFIGTGVLARYIEQRDSE